MNSPLVVEIGGDAGMGKSRLVAELVRSAESAGHLVLNGTCLALSEQPVLLAPIKHMLRSLRRSVARGAVDVPVATMARVNLLLSVGGRGGFGTQGMMRDPVEFAERLLEVFDELTPTANHTLIIVVEDAHACDELTRDVLTLVARNLTPGNLMVLTHRPVETRAHPQVGPWLGELLRRADTRHIELSPLTPAAVDRLCRAHRPDVDPARVKAIVRRAEGNPLLTVELAAAEDFDSIPASLGRLPADARSRPHRGQSAAARYGRDHRS